MLPHMRGVLQAGEFDLAQRTPLIDVALFVRLKMKVQIRIFAKTSAAFGAFERPFSCVNALMDDKLREKFK